MKIVFDIDGTLADQTHRQHYIRGNSENGKDWDSYYALCSADKPIYEVIHICTQLIRAGARIEFWTGRSEVTRADTLRWLHHHVHPKISDVQLIMRPDGDHQPDYQLKREWVQHYGLPDIVFEDRSRMVAMWRSLGVRCMHVAPGDF